jgi:hypothetical protein
VTRSGAAACGQEQDTGDDGPRAEWLVGFGYLFPFSPLLRQRADFLEISTSSRCRLAVRSEGFYIYLLIKNESTYKAILNQIILNLINLQKH